MNGRDHSEVFRVRKTREKVTIHENNNGWKRIRE
jgi:hypothetical protein